MHGDWRTAARLYGSRWRRPYAPLADSAARFALRQADGIRTVSPRTSELVQRAIGEEPLASFPAFIDLESFVSIAARATAAPGRQSLGSARSRSRRTHSSSQTRGDRSSAIYPRRDWSWSDADRCRESSMTWRESCPHRYRRFRGWSRRRSRASLDASTVLALSSRSEGLPRVVMEAFLRGRPVVSPAVGGVPDLVASGRNGLLVEAGDSDGLAQALVRVLSDRALAEQLARGASEAAQRSEWSPTGYAAALRKLVDRVLDLR